MLTVLAFLFTLGLLVTVHEYGHFQVAKWCGIKVLKFSIGFGKPLWSKRIGVDQTELVIATIPLGGFVKMLDERDIGELEGNTENQFDKNDYSEDDLSRAFNRQSVFKRIAVVLAGPFANLLLAIILYWFLFIMGVVGIRPILGLVIENSPAINARLQEGDMIRKINGQDVATWQDVTWILLKESLNHDYVEVETLNNKNEMSLHSLNISNLKTENSNKDVLSLIGLTVYQPEIPAVIGDIVKNSAAEKALLLSGDRILSVNHVLVRIWEDFVQEIRLHPLSSLEVVVLRDSKRIVLNIQPEQVVENGKKIGRIGVSLKVDKASYDKIFVTKRYSVIDAFLKSTEKTWEISIFSLKMLVKMVTGETSWKGISGPATIASYAGQSANMGLKVFIGFLAMISISIGVLNLLPIPVLDGGHLMYYMVEIFTGKPTPQIIMNFGQKIGLSLLGFLMILAFYNDINRLITG